MCNAGNTCPRPVWGASRSGEFAQEEGTGRREWPTPALPNAARPNAVSTPPCSDTSPRSAGRFAFELAGLPANSSKHVQWKVATGQARIMGQAHWNMFERRHVLHRSNQSACDCVCMCVRVGIRKCGCAGVSVCVSASAIAFVGVFVCIGRSFASVHTFTLYARLMSQ